MCVICVSPKGAPQPSEETIKTMFCHNDHGAGYMFARGGRVVIRKGFETVGGLLDASRREKFTSDDIVVYHFRIATQARRIEMTQPFPVSEDVKELLSLAGSAAFGLAHNGIIHQTSTGNPMMSDTALYIRDYVAPYVKTEEDIKKFLPAFAAETFGSRLVLLSGSGTYYLTGQWIYDGGMYFSNSSYLPRQFTYANVI